MIPKLAHRIWFGESPIPPAYENYWAAWQRQHPDYTFRTWRDSDIDERFLTRKKIRQADGMARKADIARYEILYQHGGVYLDCDMMPYHYLDWQKLRASVVTCNERESDDGCCSIGMIAAEPENEIFRRATATLTEMPLNAQPPNVETGPFFFRRMLAFGPYAELPRDAFYPYDADEPFASILGRDLAATYGIHVWKGSWLTKEAMFQNILFRLRWGDLSEAAAWASEVGPEAQRLVTDYVEGVRKARASCIVATGHTILTKYLKIKSASQFELLKCAFYLLEKNNDATIWRIGAADAGLADPLRPLAVNCDPRMVVLEPNPEKCAHLERSYARNKNITLFQAALGPPCAEREPDTESIARVTGECMSVPALLAATNHQAPEVVLIDAEGMDGEIVRAVLASGIRPKIMQYQTQRLPKSGQEALADSLGNHYVLIAFGSNLAAYRTDFFLAYCNDLYISHGIPSIYEDALKFILKDET